MHHKATQDKTKLHKQQITKQTEHNNKQNTTVQNKTKKHT